VWEQIHWHYLTQRELPLGAELYKVGYGVGAVCLAGHIHHMLYLSATAQHFYGLRICKEQTDNTPEQEVYPMLRIIWGNGDL
jgi:hypothetical protein